LGKERRAGEGEVVVVWREEGNKGEKGRAGGGGEEKEEEEVDRELASSWC
jgi:hypothetical protein